MENKDNGVKSYPLIRAAMQYVGSVSPSQCKERLQSGGKSQPPMKSQNLWLYPALPHSTSWINLWPCLCRAAVHLRAQLCPQPAKSLWGGGGWSFLPRGGTPNCWGKSLLVTFLVTHYLLIQRSGHTWFSTGFLFRKGKVWRVLYVTYFSDLLGVFHPHRFVCLFSSFVNDICWWSDVICKNFVCIVHDR